MMFGSKVTPSSAAEIAWREMPCAAASCLKPSIQRSKLPVLRQRAAASAAPASMTLAASDRAENAQNPLPHCRRLWNDIGLV